MSHAYSKLSYEQRFARLLGERIRDRRKTLGYSQKTLTESVNLHPGGLMLYREMLCRIELGKIMPSLLLLIILTEKLNVKWEYWLETLEESLDDGKATKTTKQFS